jgi:hypothetical protein
VPDYRRKWSIETGSDLVISNKDRGAGNPLPMLLTLIAEDKMRHSWLLGLICSVCVMGTASADSIYTKVRFSIRENGNFAGTVFTTLGTPEVAALVSAGCAAYGVDCSGAAAAASALIRTLASNDSRSGNEHHGIYKAPQGYEICKAKIDWGHTGIDSESTFSAVIERDPQNNGLGWYAVVPHGGGRGHGIDSDLYLQFVTAGQSGQNDCFLTNTHVWNCKGPDCPNKDALGVGYGIYGPARYP